MFQKMRIQWLGLKEILVFFGIFFDMLTITYATRDLWNISKEELGLDRHSMGIESIPSDAFCNLILEILYLNHNKLTLPPNIMPLASSLRILHLSDNQVNISNHDMIVASHVVSILGRYGN